jgi:hypothetical protein
MMAYPSVVAVIISLTNLVCKRFGRVTKHKLNNIIYFISIFLTFFAMTANQYKFKM